VRPFLLHHRDKGEGGVESLWEMSFFHCTCVLQIINESTKVGHLRCYSWGGGKGERVGRAGGREGGRERAERKFLNERKSKTL
jgi:hypothetical protein